MNELREASGTFTRRSGAPRSRCLKLTLGLLVASVVLLTMEGATRLLLPSEGSKRFAQINQIVLFLGTHESDLMLDFDSERFWKLKPNISIDAPDNTFWQGQISNSLGFRCPDFSLVKSPGTIRIICFGDSSTFGIGARMEHTWPSQLQTMLQTDRTLADAETVPHYEVINAGVPGYTSYQGLRHMRHELDRLKPDIVMASYANNDFWHWDQQTDEAHAEGLISTDRLRDVMLQSRLIQLIDTSLATLKQFRTDPLATPGNSPNQYWARAATYNYLKPVDEWTRRVPLDAFRRNITQMADMCRTRRLPLILVKWPDQPQASGRWSPRIAYQQTLDEIAAARGLETADVVRLFQDNRSWSVNTYIPNDIVHVNRYGNALAATAAKDAVQRVEALRSALTN